MGLLDQFTEFVNTPGGQGLLAAGLGALGSRTALGGISRGGLLGLQTYAGAQDRQLQQAQQAKQNQMFDLQLKQAQQAQQDQNDMRTLAQQFYKPPTMTMDQVNAAPGQVGPTNARANLVSDTQPSFDTTGFVNAYMAKDPLKAMQLRASMAKESQFDKFKPENYTAASVSDAMRTGDYSKLVRQDKLHFADTGGALAGLNPYTGQQVATIGKSGNPFEDLVVRDAGGKLVPNAALVGAKSSIAKAGKTDVNLAVNTEKSLLTTMGEGLGKQLDASLAGAQSAVNTVNTAQQIRQLASSGKIITGPGADYRVTLARLGDALGVGGKDNAEKLSNTAQLVQNLAKTELAEAQANKGQGQLTDAERGLLKRAASGDVNMSSTELVTLSSAMEKTGRSRIKQHQTQVQRMQAMPGAAPLMPFYSIEEPGNGAVDQPQTFAPAAGSGVPSRDAIAAELARRGIK